MTTPTLTPAGEATPGPSSRPAPQVGTAALTYDETVVLDMFGEWDRAGTCASAWGHPATLLSDAETNAACDKLVVAGLLFPTWETQRDGLPNLTPAGKAALALTQGAAPAGGANPQSGDDQ